MDLICLEPPADYTDYAEHADWEIGKRAARTTRKKLMAGNIQTNILFLSALSLLFSVFFIFIFSYPFNRRNPCNPCEDQLRLNTFTCLNTSGKEQHGRHGQHRNHRQEICGFDCCQWFFQRYEWTHPASHLPWITPFAQNACNKDKWLGKFKTINQIVPDSSSSRKIPNNLMPGMVGLCIYIKYKQLTNRCSNRYSL